MKIKEKILVALGIFHQVLKEETLQTLEEVDANTENGHLVGAEVVKELNNNLPKFLYDESGRIIGYKTPGGADTVFPFSSRVPEELAGVTIVTEQLAAYTGSQSVVSNTVNLVPMYPNHYRDLKTSDFIIYVKAGGSGYGWVSGWSYDQLTGILTIDAHASSSNSGGDRGHCYVTVKIRDNDN